MKKKILFLGSHIILKKFNGLENVKCRSKYHKKRKSISLIFEAPLEII